MDRERGIEKEIESDRVRERERDRNIGSEKKSE